ncbi:MAG: hypothetical protein PHU25_12285 [Deltaproteobacteria bacterium]|nr:hypothetical protein [Deltaproteobacteria bacterium]
MKRRPIAVAGYALVFVAGLALLFQGLEDFVVQMIGAKVQARILNVETNTAPRRRGAPKVSHTVTYSFKNEDGAKYTGSGPYEGDDVVREGGTVDVRYFKLVPQWNAPAGGMVGNAFVLTFLGGGLVFLDVAYWRKGRDKPADKPAREDGEQKGDAPVRSKKGRKPRR